MASAESVSRANALLDRATQCDPSQSAERLKRGLLIAAALSEVLNREPVVVGGTAEDHYTNDEYHPTDLDIVRSPLSEEEKSLLSTLGFQPEGGDTAGKCWVHVATKHPVEIPEWDLHGDPNRVQHVDLDPGTVAIIGPEDIYLDRVRQSTIAPEDRRHTTYESALAIAAANFDQLDWKYIESAIQSDPSVPKQMQRIDRRIRREMRTKLLRKAQRPA